MITPAPAVEPSPVPALEPLRPSPAQLRWQNDAVGVFFHVGVNTFADLEWSDGTIPAEVFDPRELDADQWLAAAVAAGARYVVLTAKHHDGFCLWPTASTAYSVASSPWRDGRGDLVAEVAAACERAGVRFGVYLSPWDRNSPAYADAGAYDDFYCAQLTELLTGYGPIAEIWFDGAGSEGRTYDWDRIDALCREHQPDAVRFNMGDMTIRWIGNEDGLADDPVWYETDLAEISMFADGATVEVGRRYAPPECDVSIRPGWFWHEGEEPKTLDHLRDIHDRSVGLGANLLLNLPPDQRGLIPDADVERCCEFGDAVRADWGSPVSVPLSLRDGGWVGRLPAGTWRGLELAENITDGQRIFDHRASVDGIVVAAGHSVGIRRRHRVTVEGDSEVEVRISSNGAATPTLLVHR